MKAFFLGFKWASRGVWCAVKTERNFRFHMCAAFYTLMASLFYSFSKLEYVALIIIVCTVLSLELINSAIERLVDKMIPYYSHIAAAIKDISAAAVFIFTLGAFVCGILLFWDIPTFKTMVCFFTNHIALLILLLLSLVLACWFIFGFGKKKEAVLEQNSK